MVLVFLSITILLDEVKVKVRVAPKDVKTKMLEGHFPPQLPAAHFALWTPHVDGQEKRFCAMMSFPSWEAV